MGQRNTYNFKHFDFLQLQWLGVELSDSAGDILCGKFFFADIAGLKKDARCSALEAFAVMADPGIAGFCRASGVPLTSTTSATTLSELSTLSVDNEPGRPATFSASVLPADASAVVSLWPSASPGAGSGMMSSGKALR